MYILFTIISFILGWCLYQTIEIKPRTDQEKRIQGTLVTIIVIILILGMAVAFIPIRY